MNKCAWISFIVLALVFSSISNAAEKSAQPAHWNERMKELSKTLGELLPDLISTERFNSPKNFKRIEENTKKLASLTHKMPEGSTPKEGEAVAPDTDPSIPLISGLFKAEVSRAYEELKRGRRAYARTVLRTVPNFCIGCHTRTNQGPDLSTLNNHAKTLSSSLERAELYAATRQFDRSLDEAEKIISDPKSAQGKQLEWERAARHAIAIAVRVKQDPNRALAIVDRVIASPACPMFLKDDATHWRTTLQDWSKEKARHAMTADGLLAEARQLIAKATAIQKYPSDHSADIHYLRTTAVVHELLRIDSKGSHVGEALFLLGASYEALQNLELWSLHELYYEACIRGNPHTAIAKSCYGRYEESIYAGYTGSGGMSLPPDVKVQLTGLKALAEAPSDKASPPANSESKE